MAKEIPGFYFDEEKGKYFRIQQNHMVTPGTGHTNQSVKEARQAKQHKQRMQQQSQKQRLGKISRSKIWEYSLSPLPMRLGTSVRHTPDEILRRFTAGLSRCYVNPYEPLNGSSFSITNAGILRGNNSSGSREISHVLIEADPGSDRGVDLPFRSMSDYTFYGPCNDLIASVYNTAGNEHMVISCNNSRNLVFTGTDSEGQLNDNTWSEWDLARTGVEYVWDIATAPQVSLAVVATDVGLIVIDCHDTSAVSIQRTQLKTEQMNACFKDNNTIISSGRSGRINFTDARNGQSVVRLLHSSAVTGTLSLRDNNQILAHGFSTTSIYDLRWVQQRPVANKARFSNRSKHSESYQELAVPSNRWSESYGRGRQVAYSSELDMVVAASTAICSDRICGYATLYSARTGKVIDSPLTRHVYHSIVHSVDIKRVRDGPESIFCMLGCGLDEWANGRMTADQFRHYGFDCEGFGGRDTVADKGTLSFQQEWEKSTASKRL